MPGAQSRCGSLERDLSAGCRVSGEELSAGPGGLPTVTVGYRDLPYGYFKLPETDFETSQVG